MSRQPKIIVHQLIKYNLYKVSMALDVCINQLIVKSL